MPFNSKLKHKVLNSQSREIVANVLTFMTEESCKVVIPLNKVQERVAKAVGVGLRTVQRIATERLIIECGESSSFSTPNKKRVKSAAKSKLEDFDKSALRRTVINMFVTEKKAPSLRNILKKFRDDANYKGSHESLRKALHDLGYRWQKTKTKSRILMERNTIRSLRLNYLRNMKRYREENRPIIYLDETYIPAPHTQSKNNRLIIVHAGGEDGFVHDAYLKFNSSFKTEDSFDEMSFKNYKKWIQEKLIPNLPPRSVLVVDKTPYHNVQNERCPTSNSTKDDMKSWLTNKNIPFTDDMLKPELCTLIKMYKPQFKNYEIDKILIEKGHNVLRLPPSHPELNPIALIWASLKQYVKQKNSDFGNHTERFCDEFFESFSAEEWKSRCQQAAEMEVFFIQNETKFDLIIDELIINLGVDSDNDSDSEASDISDAELSSIEEFE